MRYQVHQRVLKDSLVWCVIEDGQKIVSHGSYVSCSNACRELNENDIRLTQAKIDGIGEHRRGFTFGLTQLRTSIMGSLRRA